MLNSDPYRVGNYKISHYQNSDSDVVVVFAGAGLDFPGEPQEEFKNTLMKFGVSAVFVVDIYPSWYNSPETYKMFKFVSDIAEKYKNITSIGSSMGGSGCLIFSCFCPKVSRILSFAPQYSINRHFVQFDNRFMGAADLYPKQNFPTFAPKSARCKSIVFFGDQDWRDTVHAGMYLVEQFQVIFLKGADHGTALFLKNADGENLLHPLIKSFLDFSSEFDKISVLKIISRVSAIEFIDKKSGVDSLDGVDIPKQIRISSDHKDSLLSSAPWGLDDLTVGAETDQSSISPWSWSDTTKEDSANAIIKEFNRPYAFHTDDEDEPWWSIKFDGIFMVREIRIYNRSDDAGCAGRGAFFKIERQASLGEEWDQFYIRDQGEIFGIDSDAPFIWSSSKPILASGLRVKLLGSGMLHYKKIEIFGTKGIK